MSIFPNLAQQRRIQQALHAQQLVVHDDLPALSAAVALRIAASAAAAITARGVFHLALAGGETPRHCYQKLHGLEIDWTHVQVYFGDERCLPQEDPRRNDSMAQQALLDFIDIPHRNIHRIPAELGAQQAALGYAALLESSPCLDLVLLGMGEDGHTASLFPDNPATESLDAVVPVYGAPKPPAERVTLGLATLNAARQKIFLVAGASKRGALAQLCSGKGLPAARIAGAEWHLDRAACPDF